MRAFASRPTLRCALVLVLALAVVTAHPYIPDYVPVSGLIPVIVIAGMILPLRALVVAYTVISFLILGVVLWGPDRPYLMGPIAAGATMGAMLTAVASRARHGVGPFTGDRMLLELRDSLFDGGSIPDLPGGWAAERAFATAHGQAFSGDFDVAVLGEDDQRLEIVLVDVAGHGQKVATRSLALSGALHGIVGQMAPEHVLGAANQYLSRASWEDGFATAVHLEVDLGTGDYTLGHAGHPSAVQFVAATGRWVTVAAALGPALGLLPGSTYPRVQGRLDHGDALLLYTDGVVESPTADIADGVDWMLGRAEASIGVGLQGLTTELVGQGRAGEGDDRGAILLRRV